MANTVQLTKNGQPVFPVTDESLVTGLNYRPYDSSNPDGMGYLVLKKNKTFAEQVTEENTIYEIRYDFDLNNASVIIPTGCKMLFNGGKLKNGSIAFQGTEIIANGVSFVNVAPSGNIVGSLESVWFSNIKTAQSVLEWFLNSRSSFKRFSVGETYSLSGALVVSGASGEIDFNGCILQYTDSVSASPFLILRGCENLTIKNGILIGPQDLRSTNTQYQHGISVGNNCKNLEIANMSISKFAGDCIYIAGKDSEDGTVAENVNIHDCFFGNCVRQQVAVVSGNHIHIQNCLFEKDNNENVIYTNTALAGIDIEPNNSYDYVDNVDISNNIITSKVVSAWELTYGISIVTTTAYIGYISIHDNKISNVYGAFITLSGLANTNIVIQNNTFKNHNRTNQPSAHSGVTPNIYPAAFMFSSNVGVFLNNLVYDVDSASELFYVPSGATSKIEVSDTKFYNIGKLTSSSIGFRRCLFADSTIVASSISKGNLDCCFFVSIYFSGSSSIVNSEMKDCIFEKCTSSGTIFQPTNTKFYGCKLLGGIGFIYVAANCEIRDCLFDTTGVSGVMISRNAYDGASRKCSIDNCTFLIGDAGYNSMLIDDTIRSGSTEHAPLNLNNVTVRIKDGVNLSATNWNLFRFGQDAKVNSIHLENFSSYAQTSQAWFGIAKKVTITEKSFGDTVSRPANTIIGFTYFDTDLGKMIVWNGSAWVNMDGTALS